MTSDAVRWADALAAKHGAQAPRMVKAVFDQLSVSDGAMLLFDWAFWARENQQAPAGNWTSWGFLTGRGLGKTLAISNHINQEVEAGRAPLICLIAQDEQSAVDIQVNGPSGLIATSPPWNRPVWEASSLRLVWNNAVAYVRTPEVPGKIRGLDYHLCWLSEIQSWPNATREEAYMNVCLATRLGYGRKIWDSTPKKRHPLLKELLASHEADPSKNFVVRGTTHENAANLSPGYIAEMERRYGGTSRGKEELLGLMLEDSELALVKQAWIDETRRSEPSAFARRVVSIDPAVTNRKGSDTTGIIEAGIDAGGHAYVLGDDSGKHDVERWGEIVLDRYVDHGCDLVLAETNKGGQLVTQNLRAIAKGRGLEVIVVAKEERPSRMIGKIFVKEVFARGAKEDRAEPVATAYQRKRISHVNGVDLAALEDTLTTWEPTPNADSPGDLDALVHAMVELLDLSNNVVDPKAAFVGLAEFAKEVLKPAQPQSLARAFSAALSGGRGDRL